MSVETSMRVPAGSPERVKEAAGGNKELVAAISENTKAVREGNVLLSRVAAGTSRPPGLGGFAKNRDLRADGDGFLPSYG
jgi:hypothetical protein